MPAVTSLIASVFVDDVAEHVEREHYPAERPGNALPLGVAIPEGIKTALLTILVYLIALPFVLFAGAGFLIFFFATAWLLGREYFELAAMRFRSPAEAKAMRKDNAATVFTAGLLRSSRSRSSIWRRRCSAWPSWSTCTSGCRVQGRS
jgi:CysZ protein